MCVSPRSPGVSPISALGPGEPPGPPGISGKGGLDFNVKIFDDNDTEMLPGQTGEIVARPKRPNIMFQGYWNRPTDTVRVWRNMWFHTGDMGKTWTRHGLGHCILPGSSLISGLIKEETHALRIASTARTDWPAKGKMMGKERFERHRQPWRADEVAKLRTLADKGMALKAVAKALARSEESVRDRARQDGIKIARLR